MFERDAAIKVINKTHLTVIATSNKRSYNFYYNKNDGTHPIEVMSFEEVEYINNRENFFKNGTLCFEADIEKELYEKLNIDEDKVVKEEYLDENIKHFNKEFAEFLTKVSDNMVMARIQAITTFYKLNGYDLSVRLCRVVDARANELRAGKITSSMNVSIKEEKPDLSKELEDMRAQLEQVQKLLADKNSSKPEEKPSEPETKKQATTTRKKPTTTTKK